MKLQALTMLGHALITWPSQLFQSLQAKSSSPTIRISTHDGRSFRAALLSGKADPISVKPRLCAASGMILNLLVDNRCFLVF